MKGQPIAKKFAIFSLISVFVFVGCGDVRLVGFPEEPQNAQSVGNFCISSPDDLERYTNFMFVMDKSGSNQGTDPGAVKRADNIEKFYNENMHEDYFKWGMISFRDSPTEAYINDGGPNSPIFTKDDTLVRDAISRLRGPDGGGTPYGAALNMIALAVQRDMEDHPDQDNVYMVFFVTDGEPTDFRSDEALYLAVEELIESNENRIFLSTAYYGPGNIAGENRLQEMARIGRGKYVNFNNTDDLDFNDLIVGPTKEPWQLKNLVVYNVNATICEDGKVDADSDADGLCDRDELLYGFDPQNRWTNGKPYGDYFYWRELKYGEVVPKCSLEEGEVGESDNDFDLLTLCEESYLFNASPSGTEWTNGNPVNPDTDLDGFLDGLEIFSYRDKASAMDDKNVLKSQDGESKNGGTQIQEHRNPLVYDPEAFTCDPRTMPLGVNANGQACYLFQQSKLQLFPTLPVEEGNTLPGLEHGDNENVVYLHYIQTQQRDPNGKGILMYSFQKLLADQTINDVYGTAAGLKINDTVFERYIVPKK
jgi:hypothetical protein